MVCDALVISADLIMAGVQFGCACFMSAPMPAMCGLDMDVPDRKSQSGPRRKAPSQPGYPARAP